MFRFETVKSILFILVALCVIDLNAQGKKSLKSYVISKTLKSSCSHPPVITCPLNFSSCPGVNTSPSNTGTATAVPGGAGCGQPIVTYSDVVISIGPCNGAIEISRTWTARDPQDPTLSSSCVQNIRLRDITAPVITNCPANITVAANSNCAANVTWNPPTVTDNCGRLYLTVSHISGDRFPIGVTTVTYTAEDLCLNSS
ncbi:MAG: HYR domain-containing protein, partial [Saprospiraceae bacterium]